MGMDCFTNQVLMTEREKKYRKFIWGNSERERDEEGMQKFA